MTAQEIRKVIIEALSAVAPEGDYDTLRGDRPLRDQLDIDSFDFLNVVIRLHDKLGVDVPEVDYPKLATLDGATAYLVSREHMRKADN